MCGHTCKHIRKKKKDFLCQKSCHKVSLQHSVFSDVAVDRHFCLRNSFMHSKYKCKLCTSFTLNFGLVLTICIGNLMFVLHMGMKAKIGYVCSAADRTCIQHILDLLLYLILSLLLLDFRITRKCGLEVRVTQIVFI